MISFKTQFEEKQASVYTNIREQVAHTESHFVWDEIVPRVQGMVYRPGFTQLCEYLKSKI